MLQITKDYETSNYSPVNTKWRNKSPPSNYSQKYKIITFLRHYQLLVAP